MNYRMQHNPDMVVKLGEMTTDQIADLQNNLLDRADKLLEDIKYIGNVIMEKWAEM